MHTEKLQKLDCQGAPANNKLVTAMFCMSLSHMGHSFWMSFSHISHVLFSPESNPTLYKMMLLIAQTCQTAIKA
jgi:hypothetical protein